MSAPTNVDILRESADFDAMLNRIPKDEMDAFFAAMMEEENDGGTDNVSPLDRGSPAGNAAQ